MSEIQFTLPDVVLEQIAQRVAEILTEQSCTAAPTRWLSVADAANVLSVDPKTIRAAIRDGRLPVVHLGRVQRIREADLDQLRDVAGPAAGARRRLRPVRSTGEFTQRAKGT